MEAAGLALGVAGLTGLFSTCLECYQLVQRGATMQKDAAILMTKFENQELRLTAWGRACGLFGPEEYDDRLDDPDLSVRLVATLGCIKSLFQDEKDLSARYGLRPRPPPPPANAIAAPPYSGASAETAGEEVLTLPTKWPLGSFFRSKRQRQRFSLRNKAQWAIMDREKFAELIQHLKDFNDDLEAMTRATDVPRRQKIVVEYEIEEVEDIEVLEEIAMALSGNDGDVVSDTASIRLERIREGSIRTVSVRTGTNSNSSASFVTARSSLSLSIDEVIMEFQYGDDMSTIERSSLETSRRSIAPTIVVEQGLDSSSSSNSTPTRTQTTTGRWEPVAAVSAKTKVKCIALGDSGARITELLTVFTRGYYPPNLTPADFKNYVMDVRCDGRDIELALWDLSGQQDYPQLRKPSYDKTDVVLLCCNPIQFADSIAQSVSRWVEEVAASCPKAPIILVGIICEDISDPRLWLRSTASIKENSELKIRAAAGQSGGKVAAHVLCDVFSGENVDDVFEMATRAAISSGGGGPRHRTTRRRPNLAGFFSGLRRIKEEDGD